VTVTKLSVRDTIRERQPRPSEHELLHSDFSNKLLPKCRKACPHLEKVSSLSI